MCQRQLPAYKAMKKELGELEAEVSERAGCMPLCAAPEVVYMYAFYLCHFELPACKSMKTELGELEAQVRERAGCMRLCAALGAAYMHALYMCHFELPAYKAMEKELGEVEAEVSQRSCSCLREKGTGYVLFSVLCDSCHIGLCMCSCTCFALLWKPSVTDTKTCRSSSWCLGTRDATDAAKVGAAVQLHCTLHAACSPTSLCKPYMPFTALFIKHVNACNFWLLQVFVLNRTQEILQQQEDKLQRAVQKLEQKAGVQVGLRRQAWHCGGAVTAACNSLMMEAE